MAQEHENLLRAQVLMVDEIRGIAIAQKKTAAALAALALDPPVIKRFRTRLPLAPLPSISLGFQFR